MRAFFHKWLDNDTKLTAVFAALSAVSLGLSLSGVLRNLLPFDIAWIAIILCGVPILVGAFCGLIFDHDIKADVLVAMALVASVATKQFFAAGEVALIMQIGSLLEDYTSGKAQKGIEKLVSLTPQMARVLLDGKEVQVRAEDVKIGDVIKVLAGETIPVDGVILSGETSIDQSVMTGESVPVDKTSGDKVLSGTLNQSGVFTMRAEKASADSSLQRMVRLAKEAEENKAPVVKLADKWATWLVLVALLCAVGTWIFTKDFMRAVTVLVVFCPCAFILATPTAVLAGIGNAAKYGIIIRSGNALEKLSKITRAAFDKTGTLTYGKMQVCDVKVFSPDVIQKQERLRLAAAVEKQSEHPIGKAVVKSYEEKFGGELPPASNIKIIKGKGISAEVLGKEVLCGKESLMKEFAVIERGEVLSAIARIEPSTVIARRPLAATTKQSQKELAMSDEIASPTARNDNSATRIFVAIDGKLAGVISLSDTLREDAPQTIAKLKSAGVNPVLLTGDNEKVANQIASKCKITDVRANLLPEEKLSAIKEYSAKGEKVCMIGDGVNDALSLAAADAGIAMGGIGSEAADAVLVSDDIKRIPYLFSLTKKVMKKIKVNITAAMFINFTAVVLSALGILNPITGALWHNCGSVFVVVNAATLLRFKDKE